MHTFVDNFHQGGRYSAQTASYQAELRREEKFADQKSLSISSLQTDYLNLDSSSGSGGNIDRENLVHTKCTFCVGANHYAEKKIKGSKRKMKNEKAGAAGDYNNRRTERTPH